MIRRFQPTNVELESLLHDLKTRDRHPPVCFGSINKKPVSASSRIGQIVHICFMPELDDFCFTLNRDYRQQVITHLLQRRSEFRWESILKEVFKIGHRQWLFAERNSPYGGTESVSRIDLKCGVQCLFKIFVERIKFSRSSAFSDGRKLLLP